MRGDNRMNIRIWGLQEYYEWRKVPKEIALKARELIAKELMEKSEGQK